MGCKILNTLFRFLFSMALILIAIKGCYEKDDNKGFVSQNMRLIAPSKNEWYTSWYFFSWR